MRAARDNKVECVKWMLTNTSAKEIAHQSNVRLSLSLSSTVDPSWTTEESLSPLHLERSLTCLSLSLFTSPSVRSLGASPP